MTLEHNPQLVTDATDLPDYPYGPDDRLDAHWFVSWERRRWLTSDMRLKGTPECRAVFLDLIWMSFDHAPIGTLPVDMSVLAALAMVQEAHFRKLCAMEYGPLHKWRSYRCGDEVRLGHAMVLRTLSDAMVRRDENRERADAAAAEKRVQRLRAALKGLAPKLAENSGAVLWMDRWLTEAGCRRRNADWIERAAREFLSRNVRTLSEVSAGHSGFQTTDR